MTPENQRDEEEVIKEAKKHSQELPPHKASQKYRINSLLKIILDYQEQRQSWEREKKELINYRDACELKNYAIDALTAESGSFKESWEIGIKEIAQLRAEKKGLEERVRELTTEKGMDRFYYADGTYDTFPYLQVMQMRKDAAKELTRLKSRNEELERDKDNLLHSVERLEEWRDDIQKRFDERYATPNQHEKYLIEKPLREQIDRLNAENERLRDFSKSYDVTENSVYQEAKKEISRLTSALGAAHELLKNDSLITTSGEHHHHRSCCDSPSGEGKPHQDDCEIGKFLSDPTGKQALERWRRMEAVKEIAIKAIQDEEELEDEMPDEFWNAIKNDRDATEQALRETVKLSKRNMIKRFLEALDASGGGVK